MPDGALIAALLLALGGGLVGAAMTAVNFGLLLWMVAHLARRTRQLSAENRQLRRRKTELEDQAADLHLKLQMIAVENAKMSAQIERQNLADRGSE